MQLLNSTKLAEIVELQFREGNIFIFTDFTNVVGKINVLTQLHALSLKFIQVSIWH